LRASAQLLGRAMQYSRDLHLRNACPIGDLALHERTSSRSGGFPLARELI
jgi:hypothetical protein